MDLISLILIFLITISSITIVKYFVYVFSAPIYSFKKAKDLEPSKDIDIELIKEKINISVIVPAWNEQVGIKQSIISLLNQTYDNLEIIIVNDGSTDKTEEVVTNFIKNEFSKINTNKSLKYYYKENGGKGSALNYGIKKSQGNVIVTMDADTVMTKDALSVVARYLYNDKIEAGVGNVKIFNNKSLLGIIQQIEYTIGFYFKRSHAVFFSEYIIGGAFGVFRKDLFEKYGYFDPSHVTEDIEYSTRLQFYGVHISYIEDAIAYTEGPDSIRGLSKQRLRWKKGRLDTFIKYKSLFFSKDKSHKLFLTHFLLPVTLFYELALLIEPFVIVFSMIYLFYTQNYEMLLVWVFFTTFIHLTAFVFGSKSNSKTAFLFTPIYFILSYLLTFVEIYAMYESVRKILHKKEVKWQTWERRGINV